jgi:predicted negative regulator of RcsB-dependent stress response
MVPLVFRFTHLREKFSEFFSKNTSPLTIVNFITQVLLKFMQWFQCHNQQNYKQVWFSRGVDIIIQTKSDAQIKSFQLANDHSAYATVVTSIQYISQPIENKL